LSFQTLNVSPNNLLYDFCQDLFIYPLNEAGETVHLSTTKCRTILCFSRFYPAYFRDRYRSRTGKVSENEIGCGFLDCKLGVVYRSEGGGADLS